VASIGAACKRSALGAVVLLAGISGEVAAQQSAAKALQRFGARFDGAFTT
jgi:hypothetical protein